MNPTMLYKAPGPHEIHGAKLDYIVVEDDGIEQAQAGGWFLTTPEAIAAHAAAQTLASGDDAPPTRAELEAKAQELGIAFDGRTSGKTLSAKIAAALA